MKNLILESTTGITMKTILVFIVVFSLSILTLYADRSPEQDDGGFHQGVLSKRRVGKHSSGRWIKANSSPVCFGAKGNRHGRFHAPSTGNLGTIKLVHLYGYVSCDTRVVSHWSYWGCGSNPWSGINKMINVVITTSYNSILLPPSQFMSLASLKWYTLPGYNSLSPELVLSFFYSPRFVRSGQELRLWYAEDLLNLSEGDNGGWACCDVYALYV